MYDKYTACHLDASTQGGVSRLRIAGLLCLQQPSHPVYRYVLIALKASFGGGAPAARFNVYCKTIIFFTV